MAPPGGNMEVEPVLYLGHVQQVQLETVPMTVLCTKVR